MIHIDIYGQFQTASQQRTGSDINHHYSNVQTASIVMTEKDRIGQQPSWQQWADSLDHHDNIDSIRHQS